MKELNSTWCLRKALEAINDYDLKEAKNYVELALMWQRQGLQGGNVIEAFMCLVAFFLLLDMME